MHNNERTAKGSVWWFYCGLDLASDAVIAAKWSCGVRMYRRKAALCQRPSVCMVESSIPAIAAVVAAPDRQIGPQGSQQLSVLPVLWRRTCFSDWYLVAIDEKGTLGVASGLDVCQNGCYGAELVARASQEHVGAGAELVALGLSQMELNLHRS